MPGDAAGGLGTARPTIAQSFDPRHNSLNFLRLLFAVIVVVTHAITLGGFGTDTTFGEMSVAGFFGISGFLITRSALHASSIRRYLWQRSLRIFPGLWVCLFLTAFGFALVGWLHDHSSISGYLRGHPSPLGYLSNATTQTGVLKIVGTPTHVPYPLAWNGSLYTLKWEVRCYLFVAIAAAVGVLRRRPLIAVLALALWAAEWWHYLDPGIGFLAARPDQVAIYPIFAAGAVLALFADRIPDSAWLAVAAGALVIVGANMSNQELLFAPGMTYLCIWASMRLPLEWVGAKRDISYGVYIYAFPCQQLLAIWGVYHHGFAAYLAASLAMTVVFATLSWILIEERAMRLKKWTPAWWTNAPPHVRHGVGLPGLRAPGHHAGVPSTREESQPLG